MAEKICLELNKTRTNLSGQLPLEITRSRKGTKKVTIKPFYKPQYSEMHDFSLPTPTFQKESFFARELRLEDSDTISPTLKHKSKIFPDSSRELLSSRNQMPPLRASIQTPTVLKLDSGRESKQLSYPETKSVTPTSLKIMNRFSSPIMGRPSDQLSALKTIEQGSLTPSVRSQRVKANQEIAAELEPRNKYFGRESSRGNPQLMRKKIKLSGIVTNSYKKDSYESVSMKSLFSSVETHLPSFETVPEQVGNKTFHMPNRRYPVMDPEDRKTLVSELGRSNPRKGFLIKPIEN